MKDTRSGYKESGSALADGAQAAKPPKRLPSIAQLSTWVILNRERLFKWLFAGLAFMGVSTGILFLLVERAGLSVPVGTLLTAEICTLLRFMVNHYWVFGAVSPTLRQCVHYHVANAAAFAIWWCAANLLALWGVHYLIASILAVACSTGFSLVANFFWVWGKKASSGTPR